MTDDRTLRTAARVVGYGLAMSELLAAWVPAWNSVGVREHATRD